VWRDRANTIQQETVTSELAQGLVAYASKQAAMYTALAARAWRIELALKLGQRKSRRRVVAEYDPLVAQPDEDEENDDADDENKRVEDPRGHGNRTSGYGLPSARDVSPGSSPYLFP
jgi:hypothetical protein